MGDVGLKVTSSVTSKVPGGSDANLLSLFKKSVVSWIYDGSELAWGCEKQSIKREIFFVEVPFKAQLVYLDYQAYGSLTRGRVSLSSGG